MTTSSIGASEVGLDELHAAGGALGWPAIDVESRPDASWVVTKDGRTTARCSAWWTAAPSLPGERVGVVGHLAASTDIAARGVLDAACRALRSAGVTLALGPMDGNTWRNYRLVTDGVSERPFFMEPSNVGMSPTWMEQAGWKVHTRYLSAVNENLARVDDTVPGKGARLAARGVTIRDFDMGKADAELLAMHAVATRCFADSYLYTPLGASDFVALYRPVLEFVDARLVSIAEHDGSTVGFCFCVPNIIERTGHEHMESAVLKTFAALPDYAGLGAVLAARTNAEARSLGFKRVIHALMHERNERSRALSSRSAREIRRYALFERRLRQ